MFDRQSVHQLLHRAGQIADERFNAARPGTLTPRQAAILGVLSSSPGISQTGLVKATGTDRSTMTEVVKRLVEKGLVRRRRSRSDARAYAVQITEAGQRELDSVLPKVAMVNAQLLAAIPAAQRKILLASLQQLVADGPTPPGAVD